MSGVNIGAFAPRMYYKKSSQANDSASWKWVATADTVSPFSFVVDYSKLGGVIGGDEIVYFFVAEDSSIGKNVSLSNGVCANPASSVNLKSNNFPIIGVLEKYKISKILSGTKTVGNGGDYTTLTGANGAFSEINDAIINGDLTLSVISNLNESGEVDLNTIIRQGGDWNVKIVPSSANEKVISGAIGQGSLICFHRVKNVTIDGSFNGVGRFLTFKNIGPDSNYTTSATITISADSKLACSNISILNSTIYGRSSINSTAYGIYICNKLFDTYSTKPLGCDSINIVNNIIAKANTGILFELEYNAPDSIKHKYLNIRKNIIGSNIATDYIVRQGIYIAHAKNIKISNNEVFNIKTQESNTSGININYYCDTILIENNSIHGIHSQYQWGSGVFGLYLGDSVSNIDVINNAIFDLNAKTSGSYMWNMINAVALNSGKNYRFYNNSINLYGAYLSGASLPISSIITTHDYYNVDSLTFKNNSFTNTKNASGSTDAYIYFFSQALAPYSYTLNYNNYFISNTGNYANNFGTKISTFLDWQTLTTQEANSDSLDPLYSKNTVLIPVPSSPLLGTGEQITGVETDILGNIRNIPPSKGAYEISIDITGPEIAYKKLSNTNLLTNRSLDSVKIWDAISLVDTTNFRPRLYYKKASQPNDLNSWKYVCGNRYGSIFFICNKSCGNWQCKH